jgi:hypothetical protein
VRRICCLLVLLFLPGFATSLSAQEDTREGSNFQLEQNYPNPFNPETKIPFVLSSELFQEGQPVRVTIRIFNMLQQFVASPTALNHVGGEGVLVDNLDYMSPGRHEAFWDGRDQSGAQVASGVYFVQLIVNGQSQIGRMFVTK